MIRKILIISVILISIVWVVIAHAIKGRLLFLLDDFNSDTIEISYSDAKISGFPFRWEIILFNPRISSIDPKLQRQELLLDNLKFKFNYLMDKVTVNLGKRVRVIGQEENKQVNELKFKKELKVLLSFNDLLYNISDISDFNSKISTINLSMPYLSYNSSEEELFNMSNIEYIANISRDNNLNKIGIYLKSDCNLIKKGKDNKGNISIDIEQISNNRFDKNDFEHKSVIKNFQICLDHSILNLSGEISLNKLSPPKGQLELSLKDYVYMIDNLIYDDFVFLRSYFMNFIRTSLGVSEYEAKDKLTSLKVIFSDRGISVNK